jgi:hypothetical protein
MGRAFGPQVLSARLPGALPQAGMKARLWRWAGCSLTHGRKPHNWLSEIGCGTIDEKNLVSHPTLGSVFGGTCGREFSPGQGADAGADVKSALSHAAGLHYGKRNGGGQSWPRRTLPARLGSGAGGCAWASPGKLAAGGRGWPLRVARLPTIMIPSQ